LKRDYRGVGKKSLSRGTGLPRGPAMVFALSWARSHLPLEKRPRDEPGT
jgi:hypothetical protein